MTEDPKRLIEVAFPLKQTSLDSVHEKNVRHGHISTLHIWPARRPLAACRAALIATLLPDPGDPEERKEILERLGGKVVQKVKRKKTGDGWVEEIKEETEGGILHWGRESSPDLEWFRQKIREAYGGRAPKVLDPFAGGGAIPLEAMRLGCEATAVDINPVAWFILKCTLEYPQKLAGQTLPLPDFAVQDREFMENYLKKAKGFKGKALAAQLEKMGLMSGQKVQRELPGVNETEADSDLLQADLAWHVRAWGMWVLKEARKELAPFYPTYADFEPLVEVVGKVEQRPMQLVPLKEDGTPDIDALNAEFTSEYLAEKRNPRWVAKPAVAYLWARTVTCKNCRATLPLLKTRWLCKKPNKRIVLTMQPNLDKTGVVFDVQSDVPVQGKNPAQRIAHDKEIGGGTMSRSGATCPCCNAIMTSEDIRLEGKSGKLDAQITVVVIEGQKTKEYRLPSETEIFLKNDIAKALHRHTPLLPFGLPTEPTPIGGGSGASRAFSLRGYGINEWKDLFTTRQLLALTLFVIKTREILSCSRGYNYPNEWIEAIQAYAAAGLDRLVDFCNVNTQWKIDVPTINHALVRFAIQITWDYAEGNPIGNLAGSYRLCFDRVAIGLDTLLKLPTNLEKPTVSAGSAMFPLPKADIIVTDPPYYDSIPYSDLMDWFYVWLRRVVFDLSDDYKIAMANVVGPKWDRAKSEGELIDDSSRHEGNSTLSKKAYEDGMALSFSRCFEALDENGQIVIVFANKQPDAWETLVSSVIRAGFMVSGSWPIQTEQPSRSRGQSSAALSSSIWLVGKKRSKLARPGWDNKVLDEMRQNIIERLRDFWDAGIRGPDFVWAATGPAMEAYSKYPVVKKANEPGAVMSVSEFLVHVRRIVVDFVVGRVISEAGGEEVSGLDNVTTYYMLHRHDFGMDDAPAGPCILYAVSCNLSDKDLADRFDILARRGGKSATPDEETESGDSGSEGTGSSFRLKTWSRRKNPRMGYDPGADSFPAKLPLFPDRERIVQTTREIPLIDQVHRLMHLWKEGDVSKVNEYLDLRGLRRNTLFHQLLQALIELAKGEERSLLESISNYVGGRVYASASRFI